MNSRYYLTFKSTFQAEKPKKLTKTSLKVKILECDELHLCALNEETYFSMFVINTIHVLKKGKINAAIDPRKYLPNRYQIRRLYWTLSMALQLELT